MIISKANIKDLNTLIKYVMMHSKILSSLTLMFVLSSILYLIVTDTYYESTITLYPRV